MNPGDAKDAAREAVTADRKRCAGLVEALIAAPPREQTGDGDLWVPWSEITEILGELSRQIRNGKKPPGPPRVKRPRRTCSYCLGDRGPDGHNRSTCSQRFEDLVKGIAS